MCPALRAAGKGMPGPQLLLGELGSTGQVERGPQPPSFCIREGSCPPKRERLAMLTLWVALLSPFAQRLDGSKDCVCVCLCVHVSTSVCDLLLTTGRPHVHIGKTGFKESCLLFLCVQSGVSLGGRFGSYMVVSLCPTALTLGLQGPVWQSPAFSFSVFSLESAWVDDLAHTW